MVCGVREKTAVKLNNYFERNPARVPLIKLLLEDILLPAKFLL